jgi:nucleotide-binding universal stress UspA family protein
VKTILIPFDFAGNGRRALRYALDVFSTQKTKCVLLNVYDPAFRSTELELAALTNKFCADLQRKVWAEVDEVIASLETVNAVLEVRIELGDWIRRVVDYTNNHPVDYVVLGNHKPRWFDRQTTCNVSAFIRRSSCPVLTVPEHVRSGKPKKIAFVGDSKLLMLNERFPALRSLAVEWRTEVAVWSLIHGKQEMIDVLQSRRLDAILGKRLGPITFLNAYNPLEAIQLSIVEDPVDLLITPYYHGAFFDRLFIGNLAKSVIKNVETPLLTLPVRQSGVRWEAIFGHSHADRL